MDTQMEYKLNAIRPVLVRYASKKWSGLRSMDAEDLVQETLIYAFQNYNKWKNLNHYDSHCCRAMDYIAHNILLKEHKDGLWLEQALIKAGERKDEYDLSCVLNHPVEFLFDPWLEEYKERRRQSHRQYYERNKEEVKARSRKYYQEHKSDIKKKRDENGDAYKKEKRSQYNKTYYRKNREKLLKDDKSYRGRYYRETKQLQKEISEKYRIHIYVSEAQYLYGARKRPEEYQKRLETVLEQAKARSF